MSKDSTLSEMALGCGCATAMWAVLVCVPVVIVALIIKWVFF